MGRKTTLFTSIQVVPITTQSSEGKEEDGKQLVFTDHDTGEIILYPMARELAKDVHKKLGMSNKSLRACLDEEQRQKHALELLAGGNGGTPIPGEEKIVGDILKGVHRKEGDS